MKKNKFNTYIKNTYIPTHFASKLRISNYTWLKLTASVIFISVMNIGKYFILK